MLPVRIELTTSLLPREYPALIWFAFLLSMPILNQFSTELRRCRPSGKKTGAQITVSSSTRRASAASAALMVSACPSEGDHPYPCFAARSLNGAIAVKTKRQPKPLIVVLIPRPKLANSWKGPLDADALERQRG